MRVSSFKSSGSFAATTLREGSMARALASGWPMARPSEVALRSTAERRSALSTLATTTRGGASDGGLPRRCSRSVGRRGNHSATIRFLEETIIATPLHEPLSCPSMAVADKACFENRMAPVFLLRRRRSGAHQPAGFRRAGLGLRVEAQEKSGDGFLRAGERQPPACHQIENFWCARNLDDDSAQSHAGERIMCGAKRICCIADAKQQQA